MKRSCENCGNMRYANGIIDFFRDECVERGFTKYWRPKEPEKPEETDEQEENREG